MDKTVLSIGKFNIYWYSIFICLGILVALFFIRREAKKQKIDKEFIVNLSFYTILFSIVGARLYYCFFNWDYYGTNLVEILKVWNGGLAIHGGLLFGILTVLIYTKKHQLSVLKVLDIVVVGVIIGQAIGRWGNFFNKEAFGAATTLANLKGMMLPQFIIDGMKIGGVYYTPTFLYESIWCLFGFIVLLCVRKFYERLHIGDLTAIYFIWYGIGRFFIEGLRLDSLMLGNIKIAQLVSIIFILVGCIILIKNMLNKDKFANLYNKTE